MTELTGKERVARQLQHRDVDRIASFEHFWPYTWKAWEAAGQVNAQTDFDYDLLLSWPFDLKLDVTFVDQVVASDEDTETLLDGNGATLRRHRKHDSTPEHIAFGITDHADWLAKAKPLLTPDRRRINFAAYREQRQAAQAKNQFFCWCGVNVFECMHPIAGHEAMLMGMALEPEWITDMATTYAELTIQLWEELFAAEGLPDGIWFYEDMGFKDRPFLSPTMYRELIQPAHARTIAWAHDRGLPVIMHSCGFVEPLLPGMLEAGIDCLQAIEVKAGMDLLRIYRNYGERLALMGGLDIRPVAANDLPGIKRELEAKIPLVKGHNGFILHSDHSVPESTRFETYRYFLDLGRELGRY